MARRWGGSLGGNDNVLKLTVLIVIPICDYKTH